MTVEVHLFKLWQQIRKVQLIGLAELSEVVPAPRDIIRRFRSDPQPRPKSVLASLSITVAGRRHNCRFNDDHQIEKGDHRLTIKEDGDERHYCLNCAKNFIANGLKRLHELESSIEQFLGQAK